MITLRGKLIRSLVEAPPTKSITTRRNLPDNEAITINNDASSTAAAVTQSTENAPTSEEKNNETSTPPLVEEWLWRGVWAFGSLPEMDIDVLSGSSKPKEEEAAAAAPKKENDEEGGNWIQKLTNRIISGENKEGEKSTEGVAAVYNTAAAADADGAATDTTVKKTEEQTSPEQEGVPRPFCYRFIKCMDANDVVVPSSLLVVEEEVVPVADEEVKLVNEEENNSRKQPNDESNDEVKKDLTKSESAAVDHLGDDDNNKEGEAADEKNAAPENNAESQKTDEAVEDKDLMMSSTTQAMEGAKSEVTSAATKVQDSLTINSNKSETAKNSTHSLDEAVVPDQPPKASIQTENSAQSNTAAAVTAATTTDDKSTTQPTPKPKINKQTYGQSPYTPANLTQPTPPGGKWEGHFENIVPNTSTTTAAASKKRKDKRDNRIREVFYLFFNSTPPSDAKTAFAVEDTASTANDQLAEGKEGDATTTNKQENSLLLPEGRIHVRGYGTNRFGTFEIVGSLDVDTGILHCQRMYVETPPERDSRKPKRTASGQFSTTGRRGRPPKNKDGEGKRGRKRKPSLKKRTMDSFSSFDGVDAGPVAGAGGDIASSVKKRARLSVDSGGAGAPPSLPQCQSSSKSTPSLKGPVGKSSSKKKKLPPANKEAAISHIVQPIVDIVDPLPSDGDPLLARWRAAHYLYYQREEADPDDGEANTSTKIKSVVYEGEMVDGYRGGMGICLYNNDTMYEGQWKKNKEVSVGYSIDGVSSSYLILRLLCSICLSMVRGL